MSWEVFGNINLPDFTSFSQDNLSSETVCMASKQSELHKGFCSSTPLCKVYGCHKNLSSCKEYYKRHKVCEVHSKASKVIVNGMEQRFCQQCSRFHLLREFDDGKRSCRKRLAGHNERRRKPHGRLVPSYSISTVEGNKFSESGGAISSFHNPNDLHCPYKQMHENNVRWDMNLEDRSGHDLQSTTSGITYDQLNSKSVSPCNLETDARFINKWMIRDSISCSESAHSLLSSQSRITCNHSIRTQTSNSQSWPMFMGRHDLNPVLGFQGDLVKFGMMYYDDQALRDESCTIDLLQLSAQLERVEHQKHVNPAN